MRLFIYEFTNNWHEPQGSSGLIYGAGTRAFNLIFASADFVGRSQLCRPKSEALREGGLKLIRSVKLFIPCFLILILSAITGCKKEALYVPGFLTGSYLLEVTRTSAVIKTGVSFEGSFPVTVSGVCWSTTENPTVSDHQTFDGTGPRAFISTISGLAPNTLYYLRPYATSKAGTGYGNQIYIKTKAGEVTDIDGNVYSTIMAGDKEWMAENLKTTTLSDGSEISLVRDNTEWSKLQSPAYCKAVNSGNTYGLLYNWFTVKTGKLCPAGWHIASGDEWYSLVYPFDSNLQDNMESKSAGCDLAKPDSTLLSGCLHVTSNKSGFTAIMGSWRHEWGEFSGDRKSSRFWLPEDPYPNSDFAFCMYVSCSCGSRQTSKSTGGRESGYSVRCVKDSGSH